MNYYEHHIGDYAQATAHLSFVEDAAYNRLIRKYYAEEKPLPADVKAVQRLVGARSKEERQAVADILEEFFLLEDDGWHNKRCDAEIARYRESAEEREATRANEKERQRRHREERRELFEQLRQIGVVPKWDTPTITLREMLASAPVTPHVTVTGGVSSRPVTPHVTPDNTATQTPDTRHQTPDKTKDLDTGAETLTSIGGKNRESFAPDPSPTFAGLACKAMREAGIADTNPSHATLRTLLEAGATVEEFGATAAECVAKGKPSFAYVIGTVKRRREDAAKMVLHNGVMHANGGYESAKDKSRRTAYENLTGNKPGGSREPIDITPTPNLLD